MQTLTLNQAYEEWVETSPVNSSEHYKKEIAKTVNAFKRLRKEFPHLTHSEIELALRDMGHREVSRQNLKVCCAMEHYKKTMIDGVPQLTPLPDHLVCARERAWRRYTRIRDGLSPEDMAVN